MQVQSLQMLATLTTKAEQRAELDIIVAEYLAKGGRITVPAEQMTPARIADGHYVPMSRSLKRRRKAAGLATPREWDLNARAEFAKEDANYYMAGDNAEAGYGLSEVGIRIRPRKREGE